MASFFSNHHAQHPRPCSCFVNVEIEPGNTANKPFFAGTPNTPFAPGMLQASIGGGQPHQNQQPYLGVNFCIALQGIYPSFP